MISNLSQTLMVLIIIVLANKYTKSPIGVLAVRNINNTIGLILRGLLIARIALKTKWS